ncbi:hypothetical protein [Caballeronia sp. AZ1_KS37]|uniref:hypothetical protein n=1 Tax=Caballeronia sp. AZ1_KS37 TaxID=2921756 RepID=UPI00202879FC|nr:hypothetical protein [Caballeronia sp. AZ1_KS37]
MLISEILSFAKRVPGIIQVNLTVKAANTAGRKPSRVARVSAVWAGAEILIRCRCFPGWQWHTPAFSIDMQGQKATPLYSDLASAEGTPVPRATYRATAAAPFRAPGTSSTTSDSFVGVSDPNYGHLKIGSLDLSAAQRAAALTLHNDGLAPMNAQVRVKFSGQQGRRARLVITFCIGREDRRVGLCIPIRRSQFVFILDAL